MLTKISQGAFSIPTAAAQVLPALMGKTFLDVNKDSSCVSAAGKSIKEQTVLLFTIAPKAREIQVSFETKSDQINLQNKTVAGENSVFIMLSGITAT